MPQKKIHSRVKIRIPHRLIDELKHRLNLLYDGGKEAHEYAEQAVMEDYHNWYWEGYYDCAKKFEEATEETLKKHLKGVILELLDSQEKELKKLRGKKRMG